jgi:hypothetical protein
MADTTICPGVPAGRENSAVQGQAFISVRLDMEALNALQLYIDARMVKYSILAHPRIKVWQISGKSFLKLMHERDEL